MIIFQIAGIFFLVVFNFHVIPVHFLLKENIKRGNQGIIV